MPKRNFGAALNEVDKQFENALSPAADVRLQRALTDRKKPLPTRRTWVMATAATAVVFCAVVLLPWSGTPPKRSFIAGGLEVTKLSADLRYSEAANGTVTIESGHAALSHPSFDGLAETTSRASFLREGDALRLVEGDVDFVIEKRGTKGPVKILVSHGAIEIVGTRFTVYQGTDKGRVELKLGSIRFIALDGTSQLLEPGQVLRWPLDSNPPPQKMGPEHAEFSAPEPPVARSPRSRLKEVVSTAPTPLRSLEEEQTDSTALLQKIDMMRSRGQFGEAATTLEASLDGGYRPVTRERLSYELGSIFTRQLAGGARACAHWRAHSMTYPSGRYDQEVAAAQAELGCPAVP